MRKVVTVLVLLASIAAFGLWRVASQNSAPAAQVTVGSKAGDVLFTTLDGKPVSLYRFAGQHGTLLIFIATRCPVSNDYNQRMAELARDYTARGYAVVGVNANRNEPPEEVARHAAEKALGFTIVKDPDNRVADLFGATVTPEAFLFDTSWTLRYHGRIDDSRNPANITTRDLRAALDAVAEGKPVAVAETKAFGCTIKRLPRS
ncbi:MAG TPA: thioredoxin family protein [Candidatus Acidoferrales bacterium]|nr:thioredoxin family protein [Candidatus Acidoferrales bacterium]